MTGPRSGTASQCRLAAIASAPASRDQPAVARAPVTAGHRAGLGAPSQAAGQRGLKSEAARADMRPTVTISWERVDGNELPRARRAHATALETTAQGPRAEGRHGRPAAIAPGG